VTTTQPAEGTELACQCELPLSRRTLPFVADLPRTTLTVLQAETGGDKLVAVISHLHAVAEAVPDVLWVERGPDGSALRWLTSDQRDALVRQEVTGGLLSSI